MGACTSNEPGENVADLVSKEITGELCEQATKDRSQIKILLLGASECGKSTVLKQMKIIHDNGFTEREKQDKIALIHKNTLESIRSLCRACVDFEIAFDSPEHRAFAEQVFACGETSQEIVGLENQILALWKDSGVRNAFLRANEFNLLDSAEYFLSNVSRTFAKTFMPTEQDIIRTRLATTGITETTFFIDNVQFKMCDVGGQRGERKKWIHCFESVTAILFIAALSEYDQVLAEDPTRNRMVESLKLFEGILGLPWFKETAIILFLNKNDIFEQKIQRTDLGIYFNGYRDGLNYETALVFIKEMYFKRNPVPSKRIFAHVTDATSTENISFVWRATKEIVMNTNLHRAGLMLT